MIELLKRIQSVQPDQIDLFLIVAALEIAAENWTTAETEKYGYVADVLMNSLWDRNTRLEVNLQLESGR